MNYPTKKTPRKIISLLILFLLLGSSSCKKPNPTQIDEEPNYPPGRRDYAWTVDTMMIPYNNFIRVWGVDENELWAVGPGGDLDKTVYHLKDGVWINESLVKKCSPLSVFGFARDNVWFCGSDGFIWHYDGTKLRDAFRYIPPDSNRVLLTYLWGRSPNELYCCGLVRGVTKPERSILLKYDGKEWKLLLENAKDYNRQFIKIDAGDEIVVIPEYGYSTENSYSHFYKFNGSSIQELFSNAGLQSSYIVGTKNYFFDGYGIYQYQSGSLKLITEQGSPEFTGAFTGRSPKDIIMIMTDGLLHFNGVNKEYIFKTSQRYIFGYGMITDSSVVLPAFIPNTDMKLIIRGKLKKKKTGVA